MIFQECEESYEDMLCPTDTEVKYMMFRASVDLVDINIGNINFISIKIDLKSQIMTYNGLNKIIMFIVSVDHGYIRIGNNDILLMRTVDLRGITVPKDLKEINCMINK